MSGIGQYDAALDAMNGLAERLEGQCESDGIRTRREKGAFL